MTEPRFELAYFKRVFEVIPERDVVSLEELTYGLTNFLYKRKLAAGVQKELAKIDKAWEVVQAGGKLTTRYARRIARHVEWGGLPKAAEAVKKFRKKAIGRAKTDLRLWSPASYAETEGARREAEYVRGLSCMVLDFDDAPPPHEMSARFEAHYHIVHSTWSHRADQPKYRLCLPLAKPVHPADWRQVWEVSNERSGRCCDPALKSPSSTFALPATPAMDAPRMAFVRYGPLYDPVRDGLAREGKALGFEKASLSHFRDTDGERRVPATDEGVDEREFDLFAPTPDDWADDFDLF